MADQTLNHNHHHHRSLRLKVPPRPAAAPATFAATPSSRPHAPPYFPFSGASTPTASATPSKHRLSSSSSLPSSFSAKSSKTSLSFLFLLLFSLRSLYSLLPFLRSSPSFSLFPFSFLVSLLSFVLTYLFSLFTSLSSSSSSSSSKDPFHQKQSQPIFSLTLITQAEHRVLAARSVLLAVVFLLRFQALRYCGTAAMILAELTGNVAARFLAEGRSRNSLGDRYGSLNSKVRGFVALFLGLFLLSVSWDRIECFPFSARFVGGDLGFSVIPKETCVRIWPMLLPFLSGFLCCYERVSMNLGTIKQLGRKRVRLISLFFTTVVLFFPAVVSVFSFESDFGNVSIGNLVWPLANTVVFGVLLAENFSDEKLVSSKDFRREFLVTFVCTLVLELFYFPELSLWGLLVCGLLLYIAVRELDPFYSSYLEPGMESSEPLSAIIMKPIKHILSERKSRKIALFLMINTGYMVVEFVAGFMSNSLGLISDACHMLFDCAALAIGLYASYISRLPANNQFNYGCVRFEVLSGYVNAVFLILVGSLIVLESFERILDPQEISTSSLLTVSIGGLLVNMIGLVFFHEEHHHAHGGSGSCSHSHSHLHHQHSHDQVGHGHKGCGKHEEHISVSHESCEKPRSHQDQNHENSHSSLHGSSGSCRHDNNNHGHHEHDNHKHGLHEHCNHDHSHHRDHSCQHDHHQHQHQHQHQQQQQQQQHGHHEHDDHNHAHHSRGHHEHGNHDHADHHDHSCKHDHHHRHHHDHVSHGDRHNNHGGAHQDNCHDHGNHQNNHSHPSHHHIHDHGHHDYTRSLEVHKVADPQVEGESSKHHRHHHIDHNMEGIFLHVLADTMGSVGVVISTLLIKYKGWLVADPACSIFISVLIVSSVIPLLRNSAEILLQRVPRSNEHDLRKALVEVRKMKGVCSIQNLHIWSLTNSDVVGTLRLHITKETDKSSTKTKVSDILREAGVKDLTLQVECVR